MTTRKTTIKRPHGLAAAEANSILSLLQKKGTVTIEDMAPICRDRYIFKFIFALRKRGHMIKANRVGRKVVSYTLTAPKVGVAA